MNADGTEGQEGPAQEPPAQVPPEQVPPEQPNPEELAQPNAPEGPPEGLEVEESKPSEPTSPVEPSYFQAVWQKQPLYMKIATTLLTLLLLLWFLLPTCTTPPPAKTFLIALDPTWIPLHLTEDQNSMTTFFQLLIDEIAEKEKLKIHVVHTRPQLFEFVEKKAVDGVISIKAPPLNIASKYISSDSIYQLGFVLVVSSDSPLKSIGDFRGKQIAVIENLDVLMRIADYPSVVFTSYNNASQALAAIDNHQIDGVILDRLRATTLLESLYANRFKILSPPIIEEGIELFMHKNPENENFISFFNQGLEELRSSGTYNNLVQEWGLTESQ